jgi:hypothetical protein
VTFADAPKKPAKPVRRKQPKTNPAAKCKNTCSCSIRQINHFNNYNQTNPKNHPKTPKQPKKTTRQKQLHTKNPQQQNKNKKPSHPKIYTKPPANFYNPKQEDAARISIFFSTFTQLS